jgi:ATP-dependent Lhr-like helicase
LGVIVHSLYGRRVNDCLSRCLAYIILKTQHIDVEVGINDNGFYLSGRKSIQILKTLKLLTSENIKAISEKAIDKSEILKRRFRQCAGRAYMILREYKGQRKNVGRQQVSSMILMSAVKRISNDFPILKEARREVLEDLMDLNNAQLILKSIEEGKIEIKEKFTLIPSPFSFNLLSQGMTDILKAESKQEFLQRMHKMVLAKINLKKS